MRYRVGLGLFALSWVCPLLAIPVAYTSLPAAVKGTVMGLLTIGGPEVLFIVSMAVLGKENFDRLKQQCMDRLKMLKPGPAGRTQYYTGLVMMLVSLIPSYIMAYIPRWLPDQSPERLYVAIAADLLFLTGACVAGGDMWDKIRALFIYDAHVEFTPPAPSNAPTPPLA